MNYRWIDRADALLEHLNTNANVPYVAMDTEFVRERTYYPALALIQLAFPDGSIILADPRADNLAPALLPLLNNPSIIKVMHAAGEDLQAFAHTYSTVPLPLFDTQTAAAFSGLGHGLSYQTLVAELLGNHVEKGETRSDWLRRPLSDSQCRYAAEDVAHLLPTYDLLRRQLDSCGRADWALADMQRAVELAQREQPDRYPHLAMRSAGFLDAVGQQRLCQLLRWRELTAREMDLPRRWLLDDDIAFDLVRDQNLNRIRFDALMNAAQRSPKKLRERLWETINNFSTEIEPQFPLTKLSDSDDRATVKRMQHAVAKLAQTHQLPVAILCSRRLLEAFVETNQWPDALHGWRRALLEPALVPLLR